MKSESIRPEQPTPDQMLADYLSQCLPMHWSALVFDAPEGPAQGRLHDLLFDDAGTLQDITRAGVREQATEIVMGSPDLQELMLPEAQDFWNFCRQFGDSAPAPQAVTVYLLDAQYQMLRRRKAPLGIGMNRISPDKRYLASVTEHFKRSALPLRCHAYKFEVEELASGKTVALHQVRPLRRAWRKSFHSEISITWSSDSRHVRFQVGERLRWSCSLSNSEDIARTDWLEDAAGLEGHLELLSSS